MSKVRIGVAGANGAFGSKHLDALAQIDEVEIVAAMATTLDKADGVADKYSIPNRFDNYNQMLGLSDLDAVIQSFLNWAKKFPDQWNDTPIPGLWISDTFPCKE